MTEKLRKPKTVRPASKMSDSDMPAILVVEDDFFIREQLLEELRTLGFDDIRTAVDLRSGNEALDKGGIALAILDVNLGNDLVFPLADRIAHRRIPIIFCTAMLEIGRAHV